MSITDEEIEMEATRSWYENSSLKPPFGFLHGFDIGFRTALQNKVSDPATEQSTANWGKVGDKDKFLDEVRGKESDVSAEEVIQDIEGLAIYIEDIFKYYILHDGKDAGNLWIQFNDKFNTFKKKIFNASIVNKRKDNAVHDWISVDDRPLFTKDKKGNWICTNDGDKEFFAAVPYTDKNKPNKDLWWIRHCVIEDETGLCVVGDDVNEPAGWQLENVTHWMPVPASPESQSKNKKL